MFGRFKPISILFSLSKKFNLSMWNRVWNGSKVVSIRQFRFQPDALVDMTENLRFTKKKKKVVVYVLTLRKHSTQETTNDYWWNGNNRAIKLLPLLASALICPTSFAVWKFGMPFMVAIVCGDAQMSKYRSWLSFVYFYDLPNNCQHNMPCVFADDTKLKIESNNCFRLLNEEHIEVRSW